MKSVTLVDVSPRDGFQPIKPWISTEDKLEVIRGLVRAGFSRVEAGAFVSPRAVPQMKDAVDIWQEVRDHKDVRFSFLVPNAKGFELAVAAGVREVVYVVSVSEAHNQANVHRSVEDSLAELSRMIELYGGSGVGLRVNLATCFDCPFDGRVPEEAVYRAVETILATGAQPEFGICDTTGRAMPDHVESLCRGLIERFGTERAGWAFHGHDTYGLGVSNALAAYRAGVHVFDVAAAGLGGCPFAPGATGNTAAEDIVFTFENMGIDTGVELSKLLAVADRAASLEGACSGGHIRSLPRARILA
ncbi:MAG: hydroxymethylglutaryl-CoA lyase [Oceanospirillaceae bacterium]|nr:hydroxymethylglutaryl-CoA lyase [Oceanospirillaceae bacterium]